MLRNGIYTHLLRISVVRDDLYVHFISDERGKHPTYNGKEITDMHIPDHLSYHQDGTPHIKHKKGKRSELPFRLPDKFLSLDKLIDFPILALSFSEQGFAEVSHGLGKSLKERPESHVIIESCNITFTVVVFLRDKTGTPKERRCIDLMVMPGGFVPTSQDVTVLQGAPGIAKLLVQLNPTYENLKNDLRLFSKSEKELVSKFMKVASKDYQQLPMKN